MKSLSAYLVTAVIAGTIGFYIGSAPQSRASATADSSFAEEVEAGFRATVMAVASLAVDTEINARNIAEINDRLARMEKTLAAQTPH
ncbi:hypothetical protein [Nisaea sp.]|uniref:hypothetical protein n=1 Tax=Nisaea sp. TaxID=2024842 RepID=UPI003B519971